MKKKVVPTLRQEVKVKVDIVTSDDIKIYYTGKFQDFTARYVIKIDNVLEHGSPTETLRFFSQIRICQFLLSKSQSGECCFRVCFRRYT